jgi:hypothetical protein
LPASRIPADFLPHRFASRSHRPTEPRIRTGREPVVDRSRARFSRAVKRCDLGSFVGRDKKCLRATPYFSGFHSPRVFKSHIRDSLLPARQNPRTNRRPIAAVASRIIALSRWNSARRLALYAVMLGAAKYPLCFFGESHFRLSELCSRGFQPRQEVPARSAFRSRCFSRELSVPASARAFIAASQHQLRH